jgi:DNA-binding winged helix-turn-helix (wHTH) protein
MSESEEYLFDEFRLSVRSGADGPAEIRLYSRGRPQTLTLQEAKTLQILVERQGGFVETNALAREVCGADRADEGVIHTAVSGLRRVFNDPAKVGEFIKNERGKGYCFVKPVTRPGGKKPDRPASPPPPAVPPVDAVIGFRELLLPAGKLIPGVILVGVAATAAVSVAVIRGLESATPYVSLPQLFMLLFAIGHGLPGPDGLREDFRKEAGYDDPGEGDDARHIAEKALRRYRIYWRGILGSWFLLYVCLYFMEPGNTATVRNQLLGIVTTLFNNLSTTMFVVCYKVLNQPVEIKAGKRDINDIPWLGWGLALAVAFFLVEISTFRLFDNPAARAEPLYALNLVSGIVGAIGMALYMGRLQSKFLGPSPGLVITLYSYTAIQPLFIFLVSVPEDKQVFEEATVTLVAVALINTALILKCLLFLYVTLLVKSGSLLFYFVKVRRTYLNVAPERQQFQKFLKWEG